MNQQSHILPAVAVAIFNSEGEILLQRRNDANKWCVISGHVEFGETVQEAAIREIFEETNCEAAIVRLIGVYSSPSSQTYIRSNGPVQYVTTYFEATLTGTLSLGYTNNETAELKFFSPSGLPADLDQVNPYWLTDAMSNQEPAFIR